MPTRKRTSARALWLVDVVVLVLIGGYVWLNSATREDIKFWDESLYLERGQTLGFSNQPGWEWNPLYSDIYWLLDSLGFDPINAYFAGRYITAMLIVVAVYVSIRMFASRGVAATGALVMASLPVTYVWPGVASPAAACVLLAIAVAWRWRSLPGWVAATALLWFAAAVRAEYVWAALAATVVFAVTLIVTASRRTIRARTALGLGIVLIGVPLVLSVGYGSPLELGKRSWEAFSQHYEYRFAVEGDDPWNIDATKVEMDFPGIESIPAAAIGNPTAFAGHVVQNITWAPVTLAGHTAGFGGTSTTQNLQGLLIAGVWSLSLLVLLIASRSRIPAVLRGLSSRIVSRSSAGSVVITLLGIGASLISVGVIYPRPHYLVVFVALLVTGSALLLSRLAGSSKHLRIPMAAIVILSALWVVTHTLTLLTGTHPTPNATSLRVLADMGQPPLRLLTPERPIAIYADSLEAIEEPTFGAKDFGTFLEDNRVDVIYDGILFRSAPWSALPGFDEFVDAPEDFGFTAVTPDSAFLVQSRQMASP